MLLALIALQFALAPATQPASSPAIEDPVWISPFGSTYHARQDCPLLGKADAKVVSLATMEGKRTPCRSCAGSATTKKSDLDAAYVDVELSAEEQAQLKADIAGRVKDVHAYYAEAAADDKRDLANAQGRKHEATQSIRRKAAPSIASPSYGRQANDASAEITRVSDRLRDLHQREQGEVFAATAFAQASFYQFKQAIVSMRRAEGFLGKEPTGQGAKPYYLATIQFNRCMDGWQHHVRRQDVRPAKILSTHPTVGDYGYFGWPFEVITVISDHEAIVRLAPDDVRLKLVGIATAGWTDDTPAWTAEEVTITGTTQYTTVTGAAPTILLAKRTDAAGQAK